MKRDDQILTTRLQTEATRDKMIKNAKDRDRALARTGNTDVPVPAADVMDLDDDEGALADERDHTKTIIIHVGSQNLRIGLASDALPKTIPMCCAVPMPQPECEVKEPLPRRQQATGPPEEQWGEEWAKKYQKQCNDLKIDMRANKRKVLPNSKELVVNYNRRTPPEKISEHNDPVRIEWTDVSAGEVITGHEAQRIPDDSKPAYRIYWPIQNGRLNEKDFSSREQMKNCIDSILMDAMMKEKYMTKRSQLKEFSCVYIIPDLYDKKYVELVADSLLTTFGFMRIAFIQESLAASFGAGYTSNCIVDIGAQKTSICCVEDGMCVDDSRVNVKYGGYDVTETFIKMMLFDYFPYSDINLMRRYDFLLAEELKQKFCTMNQAEISVQLYNFHLRAPGEYTRKYNFKTYDEVILAPMGMFDPSIFDNSDKLAGRRKLIDRSYNVYDPDAPDDPISAAQCDILAKIKPSLAAPIRPQVSNGEVSTPMREKPQPFNLSRFDSEANGTPGTSTANSPAPEGANTPNPEKMNGYTGSPAPAFQFSAGFDKGTPNPDAPRSVLSLAIERDTVLPLTPLDAAIVTSIMFASKNDEKKLRDFMGGIMVIGGGAKTPGFLSYLEDRLKKLRPDLADRVMVGTSPREMDGQVVTWKGGQVYSKLSHAQESFIGGAEWERLGCRVIHNKAAWFY
jgi:actin-related protein 8